ncbi:hypothetical protein QU38_00505, partial [Staphylococcus aureus]
SVLRRSSPSPPRWRSPLLPPSPRKRPPRKRRPIRPRPPKTRRSSSPALAPRAARGSTPRLRSMC